MMNAPATDVMDYLYQFAETDPSRIIEFVYKYQNIKLMLLMIDAKRAKCSLEGRTAGLWMLEIMFSELQMSNSSMKTPQLGGLKDETYPEYAIKTPKSEPVVDTEGR